MEMKWTITAGELLQIISILVAGFTVYNRITIQINDLKTKIEPLWQQFINERESVRHWKQEHQEGD